MQFVRGGGIWKGKGEGGRGKGRRRYNWVVCECLHFIVNVVEAHCYGFM